MSTILLPLYSSKVVFKSDEAGIKKIATDGAKWVKEESELYDETDWSFEYSPELYWNRTPLCG